MTVYQKQYAFSVLACVASVSVWFRRNERGTRVKDREKSGAKSGYRFISRAVIPKVPFLGISLLRNQTETLATQAISVPENTFTNSILQYTVQGS